MPQIQSISTNKENLKINQFNFQVQLCQVNENLQIQTSDSSLMSPDKVFPVQFWTSRPVHEGFMNIR